METRRYRMERFAACAVLLMLLAASSYAGTAAMRTESALVPVMVEVVSERALSAVSLVETKEKLITQRRQAIVQLESVLEDPRTDRETAAQALREKTEMAARMEMEAALELLLMQMGFEEAAVIAGKGTISIVAPWQAAENEQNRLQIIDAACGHTGIAPENVKIILAKK